MDLIWLQKCLNISVELPMALGPHASTRTSAPKPAANTLSTVLTSLTKCSLTTGSPRSILPALTHRLIRLCARSISWVME